MKTTPYITEEHIVAWLDGEIVGAEFDGALGQDAKLAAAAEDYSAITRIFSASRADKRFALSATADARVRASLQNEIAHTRKTIRMPERAPLAAPIPSVPAERVRKVWARRSAIGFALAALLAIFWLSTQTNNNTPATATINTATEPTAPVVPTPQVTAPSATAEQPATIAPSASVNAGSSHHNENHVIAASEKTPDLTTQPVAETVTPTVKNTVPAEDNDPAAVMASHRFAKLIKSTQTVVISQQDKM
ncbi:MAG TPA: hypothetical protein VEW28_03875 [Candidatus Kapabacteria bacterium]|nr:hypothetical protein [Candidatus Kapabacteria bacterium]